MIIVKLLNSYVYAVGDNIRLPTKKERFSSPCRNSYSIGHIAAVNIAADILGKNRF